MLRLSLGGWTGRVGSVCSKRWGYEVSRWWCRRRVGAARPPGVGAHVEFEDGGEGPVCARNRQNLVVTVPPWPPR